MTGIVGGIGETEKIHLMAFGQMFQLMKRTDTLTFIGRIGKPMTEEEYPHKYRSEIYGNQRITRGPSHMVAFNGIPLQSRVAT